MNFVLVHYEADYSGKPWLARYYQDSYRHHRLQVAQIRRLYGHEAVIHVVTNKPGTDTGLVYHPVPDLEPNNYAKLHVFGLLSEPAMYVDSDVLITSRFLPEHTVGTGPFNLFQKYLDSDPVPDGLEGPLYNTGVIWIGSPDPGVTRDLLALRDRFRIHENGWVNDEYPISHWVKTNTTSILLNPNVNAYRKAPSFSLPVTRYQSVHYTGAKELFVPEYLSFWGVSM